MLKVRDFNTCKTYATTDEGKCLYLVTKGLQVQSIEVCDGGTIAYVLSPRPREIDLSIFGEYQAEARSDDLRRAAQALDQAVYKHRDNLPDHLRGRSFEASFGMFPTRMAQA